MNQNDFTIGITDDVTYKSLPVDNNFTLDFKGVQCLFYGLGSDGMVSANKNTIKIIGDNTKYYAQGFFLYDSKKEGGLTRSYLRIDDKQINRPYLIEKSDFVCCASFSYINKYDMLDNIKDNGIFLLNTIYSRKI